MAHLPGGGVAVRDSKDRAKAAHVYTRPEWEAFMAGAKNGEFDLPVASTWQRQGGERTAGPRGAGTHRRVPRWPPVAHLSLRRRPLAAG